MKGNGVYYEKNVILAVLLVLLAAVVLNTGETEEQIEYNGILMQVSGIWFLQTSEGLIDLEIGDLISEDGTNLELAIKDSITAKGIKLETTFSAKTIILNDTIFTLRVADPEESDYTEYKVNSSRCIGCRLCVKTCPVGTINKSK